MAGTGRDHGSLWSEEEVTVLIAIWGEEEIQRELDGSTRNIKVYEKIASRLSLLEDCSERTAVQCREKIKKLKGEYRKAKDNNTKSGRGRTICAFFNQLDAILGCRPASAPSSVIGSMDQEFETSEETGSGSMSTVEDSDVTDQPIGEENEEQVDFCATQGRLILYCPFTPSWSLSIYLKVTVSYWWKPLQVPVLAPVVAVILLQTPSLHVQLKAGNNNYTFDCTVT